jgi:hypothetical protein
MGVRISICFVRAQIYRTTAWDVLLAEESTGGIGMRDRAGIQGLWDRLHRTHCFHRSSTSEFDMILPDSVDGPKFYQADSFQGDIFPLAPSAEPALSASDFFGGKEVKPNLMSLENGAISSSTVSASNTIKKAEFVPTKTSSAPAPAPESVAAPPSAPPSTKPSAGSASFSAPSERQTIPVTTSPTDSPMAYTEPPRSDAAVSALQSYIYCVYIEFGVDTARHFPGTSTPRGKQSTERRFERRPGPDPTS